MIEAPTSALCTLSTLHDSSWPSWDYEMTQPDTRQTVHISDRETSTVNLGGTWCYITKLFLLSPTVPFQIKDNWYICKQQNSVVMVAQATPLPERGKPWVTQNQVQRADKQTQTQRYNNEITMSNKQSI